jgi:two-component system chemotaxis response regulator CheB
VSFEIIALATSAGGLKALSEILAHLPDRFPVPILVVQHLDPRHSSLLAHILSRCSTLKIQEAEEGDRPLPGNVYIAPPNHHLLVSPDKTLLLTQTPEVRFLRPSANVLFESMAPVYRNQAIAVILTGTGTDGLLGAQMIHEQGGIIIAQSEESCEFSGMPKATIQAGIADYIVPLTDMAATLIALTLPE